METYKGIDLNKHKSMKNYIDTYYFISKKDCIKCLEDDKTLQDMVKAYYNRKRIKIVLFNLIPLIVIIIGVII